MLEDEIEQESKKVRAFARLIARTKPKPQTIKKVISIFVSHLMYAEKLETIEQLSAVLTSTN